MPFYSVYLIILWLALMAIRPARKVTLMLTPWLLFACSYDWMRLLPNYAVNPIDIRGIYEAEKALFGIATPDGVLIPGEWFNIHNTALADLLAGIFYLCWIPVPIGYALWLYFTGRKRECAKMSVAFLWVNLFGFCFYYVHPAAPPWYVLQHGFDVVLDTPGSVAGLDRFDSLMPFPVFANIYSGNSNVFAAVPSLHSAYVLTAAVYAILNRNGLRLASCFLLVSAGIWFAAVYSCHHYVIDVILGIVEAFVAIALLECVICRIPCVRRAFDRYVELLE